MSTSLFCTNKNKQFFRHKSISSFNQLQEPVRFNHSTTFFWLLPISLLLIYQLSLLLSFAWFAPSYRRVSLLLFCRASTFPPFVSICVGWARRSMPLTPEADRLPLFPPNLHLSAGILQLAAEWKPFPPRTIQNKHRHFSADEGGVMKFQGDFKISFIVVNVCWLFQENEIWIILILCHEWTGNMLSSFVLFNNLWKSTSL